MATTTTRALVREWHDLLALHAQVTGALERELHDFGLGVSEFEVLERLVQAGSCRRMQELSDAVHLSQSALSRVIARLERDGLVTREMCPDDRRGVSVAVTAAGRKRHSAAVPKHRAVLKELL